MNGARRTKTTNVTKTYKTISPIDVVVRLRTEECPQVLFFRTPRVGRYGYFGHGRGWRVRVFGQTTVAVFGHHREFSSPVLCVTSTPGGANSPTGVWTDAAGPWRYPYYAVRRDADKPQMPQKPTNARWVGENPGKSARLALVVHAWFASNRGTCFGWSFRGASRTPKENSSPRTRGR